MTFQEAYNMVKHPVLIKGKYEMYYDSEDDFVTTIKKLGQIEPKGFLEVVTVNDVFMPYEMHGMILKLNYNALPEEIEFNQDMLKIIRDTLQLMDRIYWQKGVEYIVLTKRVYAEIWVPPAQRE